jgi:RNA polymerase sigma factor (sigma-70 family)
VKSTEVTPEEFEELFRRSAPEVHAYLRRRVGTDADDLLGEVFVIAWQRRRDLPRPELRRAWLYGVGRRLILANGRKQSRAHEAVVELSRLGAAGSGNAPDRDAAVRRMVEMLPDKDRELIMLTVWEGLTPTEAALAVGVRPGTARVRLHRARQRLAAEPDMEALATRADRRGTSAVS